MQLRQAKENYLSECNPLYFLSLSIHMRPTILGTGLITTCDEDEIDQDFDAEKAIANLVKRNAVPPNAKKLFGAECVNNLYGIANDPAMLQIDAMVYKGELTLAEGQEYTLVLPEYDVLQKKIDNLAKKIVADLVQKKILRATVQKSVPGTFSGRQGGKLFVPCGPLNSLFSDMALFISSQHVEGNTYRNTRINLLLDKAIEYFTEALMREISKKEYDDKDREVISEYFFLHWDRITLQATGHHFLGGILMDMREHVKGTTKSYRGNFDSFLQAYQDQALPKRIDDDQLQRENGKMFEDAAELAQIQKIGFKRVKLGRCTLDIEAGKLLRSRIFKENSLCIVRVNMDMAQRYFKPQIGYAPGGDGNEMVAQHRLSPASIEFYLDRSTGELCYILTHIPASDSFSKHDYLLLKHAVYSTLVRYLEEKATAPVQKLRDEVAFSVATSAPQAEIAQAADSSKNAPVDNIEGAEEENDAHSEWKRYLRLLRGTSGNRIFHALKYLLGAPVRTNGSHKFFKGLSGKTHVIALHGTKSIGIGMLEVSLKAWGITPKDVYEKIT